MKKLLLLLLIAPVLGFGQAQYRLEGSTETQMEYNRKIIRDYDENGNLLDYLYKDFDEDSQTFINRYNHNYIYDNNNLQIEYTQSVWENESWVGVQKRENEYINGVISQSIYSDWENGLWVYEYKDVSEYKYSVKETLNRYYAFPLLPEYSYHLSQTKSIQIIFFCRLHELQEAS